MNKSKASLFIHTIGLLIGSLVLCVASPAVGQSFSSQDRDRGVTMLKLIKDDISKHYYDPNFHGIDLDARFKVAESKMKLAKSNAEVFGVIAQVLLEFNDSHTAFIPPQRQSVIEYGWLMKMVGDTSYVTEVKLQSDAEAQGLKPGDQVLTIDGIRPTRPNTWIFYYLYYRLAPRPTVKLVVQSPGEPSRPLEIKAKVQVNKRTLDLTDTIDLNKYDREFDDDELISAHRFNSFGDDLIIWKMPQFNLTRDEVDVQIDRVKKTPGADTRSQRKPGWRGRDLASPDWKSLRSRCDGG